jgi:hypothetical protein
MMGTAYSYFKNYIATINKVTCTPKIEYEAQSIFYVLFLQILKSVRAYHVTLSDILSLTEKYFVQKFFIDI